MPNTVYQTDGSMDFSHGVDSGKVTLLQSSANPNGLRRDQLAWLDNGTVRGGGIQQRPTWRYLTTIADGSALYQSGWAYDPRGADPYFIFQIGGRILRVDASAGAAPVDLSAAFGLVNPATVERAYFQQGEEFLVIQAGDYGQVAVPTLPLFWDGATLRRSNGLTGIITPGNPNINEIPAATVMDYYQQRLWYGQNRVSSAGDIVGGPSGTAGYGLRDSILRVTENPLAIGGDGFAVPTDAGSIRALAHSAAIDTTLGESQLFVYTRKNVFALSVPVTRALWTSTTEPLQRVIQKKFGTGADRSVVAANGDLFYQTMEPGIRSLALAVRFFNQWGNTPISRNINRLLTANDRALLRFGSGILFDNRVWQTALPYETPVGVAHKAVGPLDLDIISSFEDKLQGAPIPAWEGVWEGLNILQLFVADFGGLDRAFAAVFSEADGTIQLWELTSAERFENGDNRVTWQIEWPAFSFDDPTELKELQTADIWIDRLSGTVDFELWYKVDFDPCLHFWNKWQKCVARDSCEFDPTPICYPITPYNTGYEIPMRMPHPPRECDTLGNHPAYQGRFFQPILRIKGFCRVRGILLFASHMSESLYTNKTC